MNVGFLVSIGIAAAIIVGDSILSRGKYKKHEEEKLEYQRKIEYNKTHLPSKELQPLSPDWDRIEEIVKESQFDLRDIGESYEYFVLHNYETWKRFYIPKSELSEDTVKLIDMLLKDVGWFYAHHTGNSVSECAPILESYLREKYPILSADCISTITNRYCINDR